MATDHAQSLRLGQRPPSPTPGVQLVALAGLPEQPYRGQIVYALDIDEFRVFDGDAWQIPTAATTGGTQMFVQATAPVADNVGDLWMKNTTYQMYVWDGSVWQEVQDPTADAAQAAAAAAQVDATNALGLANNAQATADGKITTFYQSTEPAPGVENPQEGDIWFRTSDNRAFIYHSGAFVEIQDQAIVTAINDAGTAQATADQKISSYFQSSAPWPNGATGHGNDIGDLWYDTSNNNKPYRWDGNWTAVQDGTIAIAQTAANNAQSTANTALSAANAAQSTANSLLTDGLAPTSSPTPESFSGIGFFILKWSAITNHDPVTYDVHVSTTSGFTASSGTKVGQTTSTQFNVKALPGSPPAPGSPDPRLLDYNTTYYAVIVARDADGSAAQSSEVACMAVQATGVDIAADSVTAAHIVSNTITGDLLSSSVVLAGSIKTADTGQRVEVGTAGVQAYKSDNSLMINLPTDSTQTALVDAEVVARSLTATNGGILKGTTTVDNSGVITLKRTPTAPASTPQMSNYYATVMPSTASLTDAQKTGPLGLFELVPTEVTCIEWKAFTPDYWVIHQARSNGTRSWFFRVSDGSPQPYGSGGTYFTDATDWNYHSVIEIPSGGTHPGVYRMARWLPDGALNTYYLHSPAGLNRYSRQNSLAAPAIGTDGNTIFTAEVVQGTTNLRVRYWVPDGVSSNNLGGAMLVSTTDSTLGYTDSHGLCTLMYSSTGWDMGTTGRYGVAERGWNTNQRSLNVSGGAFYPGGSGNNWSSADKEAESFESPTANRRGMAWDATNACFWTYGGDGLMYKHTSTFWNPNTTSSKVWAEHTFYDSVGTVHESTPGPITSITWNRRSSVKFSLPPITAGGVDDPNQIRTYMGRGATQPTNANMWLQFGTSGTTATVSTITLSGTNPPTVNSFPNSTPGKITSDDGTTLVISGDGSLKIGGTDVAVGAPTYVQLTSGTSWTKPAGLKAAFFEAIGGGGAGGGAASSAAGNHSCGAGGGAGGTAKAMVLAANIPSTVTYAVGAGGTGVSAAAGNSGGATTVTLTSTTLTANGGGGGASTSTSTAAFGPQPGGGGSASGGDINLPGSGGGPGWGNAGFCVGGQGGASAYGAGGNGRGTATAQALAGLNGGNFGGGGGGAVAAGTATNVAGGNGGSGAVLITCYF